MLPKLPTVGVLCGTACAFQPKDRIRGVSTGDVTLMPCCLQFEWKQPEDMTPTEWSAPWTQARQLAEQQQAGPEELANRWLLRRSRSWNGGDNPLQFGSDSESCSELVRPVHAHAEVLSLIHI